MINQRRKRFVGLLSALSALGLGVALAAALFNPDLVNSTTNATQPVGWAASPVASGYKLTGTQTVYVVDYSSHDWSGNLHSRNISAAGLVSNLDNWDGGAREQIENQTKGIGPSRKIVTSNGSTGVRFLWANLTAAQKTALDSATASTASTSPVLEYMRGSHANEAPNGNNYRARTWVLGDIIHSSPAYWDDGTNRTVYVGANDGMLHAINADDGSERFAYIPSTLIPKLPSLLAVPYQHKYFVDGQLAVRKFGSQSILVGGLGGGGKGLFGLDVTAVPTDETDAATKVLWEITNSGEYANLGHTYGEPILTKLPDGTNVALMANGYNNTGNGHATLYLINPVTGARIAEIDTGSGTTATPNGLSSPTIVGNEADGTADYAYAGDLDGHLWKFDLAARTATLLQTTSPAQAITMAPGVKAHPLGGTMVTFVTGRIFEATDKADAATHYAYGIWDRPAAYAANDTLLAQTLTETSYTGTTPAIRVRTASNNPPDWTPGVGHHKGWRVPLPIGGERVVADGAYVAGSVFLFLSTNPTINPSTFPPGENWWMELNYLTGGETGSINFDLNLDGTFTVADKVGTVSPVGRHMGGGVRSQLTGFTTPNYEIYFATYDVNGDPPITTVTSGGVAGGHFDYDSYFGKVLSNGTQATATITVGTAGQASGFPAALGAITVDGVVVVPALTTSDIVNGTATTTNATTIKNKVGGGFTAAQSGAVITIKAPVGASYNGLTIDVADGTESLPLEISAGEAPTPGQLVITSITQDKDIEYKCGGKVVVTKYRSLKDPATNSQRLDQLYTNINGTTVNGYTPSCTKTESGGVTTAVSCSIAAPVGPSACTGTFTLTNSTASTNTGPQGGVTAGTPVPGRHSNFKPALTTTVFSGGADATMSAMECCTRKQHDHEYDDKYNVTGVNMLDPSEPLFNIAKAIPSKSTQFKILVQNQYLSPAVKLHLNGTPAYQYNVDAGYVFLKDFQTTSTLDVASLPTYSRRTTDTTVGGVTVYGLRSFAINMPVDAFAIHDWWGGRNGLPPDPRAGLHPTRTGCVNGAAGSTDGSMFEPVIPPGTGGLSPPDQYPPPFNNVTPASIPSYGLLGYKSGTTQATAQGVRHNGALTIQVIKDTTPQSAVEMSIPNHPEYGWRVTGSLYTTYVLAEYTIFWHWSGPCFGEVGWVKDPPPDNSSVTTGNALVGTDPKIGALTPGGSGAVAGTVTTTVTNPDGSTTTTTVVTVINPDGSATITTTVTNSSGGSTTTTVDGAVNQLVGNVDPTGAGGGGVKAQVNPQLGRINWRELFK